MKLNLKKTELVNLSQDRFEANIVPAELTPAVGGGTSIGPIVIELPPPTHFETCGSFCGYEPDAKK